MLRSPSLRSAGFTLVELAIVVAIAGLLFSGLWRLMSSGNAQLREQAAADQLSQLANATRSFIASQGGQAILLGMDASVAPAALQLTLPTAIGAAPGTAACGGASAALANWNYCSFLPAGFLNVTPNAYNQTYTVVLRKLDGAATISPQNYDFMIMTAGGDVITDNSGGRISANIGASGGFIYSVATCGAATFACGAFGGFAFDPAAATAAGGFGTANPGAGHIVALFGKGSEISSNGNWLARLNIPGDVAFTFNTMVENLSLATNARLGNAISTIDFTNPGTVGLPATAGGRINLRTGVINMNDGLIATDLTANALNLDNSQIQGPGYINLDFGGGLAITGTPLIVNTTGAAAPAIAADLSGVACDITQAAPPCTATLQISGSANITNSLSIQNNASVVNTLTAGSFIYSSDMRLKKDIAPLDDALGKISRLQGYHFRWRSDDRQDIGLLAQEVRKVYPELVRTTGPDGKFGVAYGNLIAPMIEAIKELKAQNEALRARIDEQQRAIDALQHRATP